MSDLLRTCIEAATRAPSKHNAQPWRFEVSDGVIELHADASRAMPVSDPEGREMVIGCGAALYALRLAMRCEGRDPLTVLFPEGPEQSLLARVVPGAIVVPTEDDLALRDAIALRHTDRGPLDGTVIPQGLPFALQSAAESQGATLHLVATEGARRTLASLIARTDRVWARGDRPLAAVLWTDDDHPFDWLRAGMALEAVLLRATVHGVSASFLNQPVEVPWLRELLREDLRLHGFPQIVLRLGAGTGGVPVPRRAVDAVTSWSG